MNLTLVPVGEIHDVPDLMRELSPALLLPQNTPVETEFQGTRSELSTDNQTTAEYLCAVANRCQTGVHEVFAACLGDMAIGLSWMTTSRTTHPDSVPQTSPNLSTFIAYPWQRRGYGLGSLLLCLQIAEERYDSQAWTLVRKDNNPSRAMVKKAGLRLAAHDASVPADSDLFVYGSA